MSGEALGYTAYQARTQWYMNHWGPPAFVRKALMEDGHTKLGVMAFPPDKMSHGRDWWTFATNGMSERRMPCVVEPHGDPKYRLELITYANAAPDWIPELLIEMARYPFEHQTGFAIGHTIPVTPKPSNIWSGYVLLWPRYEPEEFNPLGIDVGIGSDSIFFAEVMGLKADELRLAIEIGGPSFAASVIARHADPNSLRIDIDRTSLL